MLALTYLSILLEGVLAVKLLATGLFRTFRFFTAYLLVMCARDLVAVLITQKNTHLYQTIWAWTGVAFVLFQATIVLELYNRVHRQIPDLGVWSRRFLIAICAFAATTAAATTAIDLRKPLSKSLTQAVYTLTQRNLGLALAIIAVLSVAVFFPFRVRLRRNTIIHSYLLAMYLATNTVTFGAMNLELIRRRSAGFAIVISACLSYGAWLVLLKPSGESLPTQLPPLSPGERDDLDRTERGLMDAGKLSQAEEPPAGTRKRPGFGQRLFPRFR